MDGDAFIGASWMVMHAWMVIGDTSLHTWMFKNIQIIIGDGWMDGWMDGH